METESIESYLRSKLPDRDDLRVTGHNRIVGGMSRETWFVDFEWAGGSERVTFRVDHEAGAVVPVPLWWEFRVLDALHGSAVPVAEPYWFEDDSAAIGGGHAPFYVRETIDGTASPKRLYAEGNEALRERIGYQFAELLGKVHTFDWRNSKLPDFMHVPEPGPECARVEMARWRKNLDAHQSEPLPVMAELLQYLHREAPTDVDRVSLVWGDVGVGNFIFRDDDVVALTDWEQSHLGDPMKDWASGIWRGIDNLLPREKLYEHYERTCGIPINEASIDYYLTFIDAQYVCLSHPVLDRFQGDDIPDVTFARLGMGIPWYCLDHGYRMIGN